MEKRDCFFILQVSPDATLLEARKAYMRLVKRWHPDRFADNPKMRESAQEKLKIINSAYEEAKAAIGARIEREAQKGFSKPPPASPKKSPESAHTPMGEPRQSHTLFPAFRNSILNRFRRFFSAEPKADPQPQPPRGRRPKPGMPTSGKGEEKDFQKIFNDAVRRKTGKPYRASKRAGRMVGRSEKDSKGVAQNTASRPVRSRRKPCDRVERVKPIRKIKGL